MGNNGNGRTEDSERIKDVVESVLLDYESGRDIDKTAVFNQPDQEAVRNIVTKMIRIIYPGYYRDKHLKSYNMDSNLTVWL